MVFVIRLNIWEINPSMSHCQVCHFKDSQNVMFLLSYEDQNGLNNVPFVIKNALSVVNFSFCY